MGHYYNPNIPIRSLNWLVDIGNFRSYPGTGNTINNLFRQGINNLLNSNSPTFTAAGATSYLTYNGTNQSSANGSITSGASIGGPITINVIFNPNSTSAISNVFSITGGGGTQSVQIGFRPPNGSVWKNGGTDLLTYPTVGIGTVCHLAYTCDGANNSKVYINGKLWQSGTVATNTGTATTYTIGSYNSGAGGEFFSGRVYFASVHNVVLDADEVAQTYHSLKRRWGYSGVGTFVNGSNPTGDPSGSDPVGGPQ